MYINQDHSRGMLNTNTQLTTYLLISTNYILSTYKPKVNIELFMQMLEFPKIQSSSSCKHITTLHLKGVSDKISLSWGHHGWLEGEEQGALLRLDL